MGPLHVNLGTPCQDACAYEVSPAGLGVIAVADGLGSAACSDRGARAAVDAAVRTVLAGAAEAPDAEPDLQRLARAGVSAARAALKQTAADAGCQLRDLACTMLLAVVHGDRAASAQVGDGAIVAQTAGGLCLLSAPGDSEYANEVAPLTARDWAKTLRISEVLHGVRGLMAFTDGCQRAALRKTRDGFTPFAGFCEPLLTFAAGATDAAAAIREVEELLRSPKLAGHSEDDKTLVLAVLPTPGEGARP
jgi:hypothetical protein